PRVLPVEPDREVHRCRRGLAQLHVGARGQENLLAGIVLVADVAQRLVGPAVVVREPEAERGAVPGREGERERRRDADALPEGRNAEVVDGLAGERRGPELLEGERARARGGVEPEAGDEARRAELLEVARGDLHVADAGRRLEAVAADGGVVRAQA